MALHKFTKQEKRTEQKTKGLRPTVANILTQIHLVGNWLSTQNQNIRQIQASWQSHRNLQHSLVDTNLLGKLITSAV